MHWNYVIGLCVELLGTFRAPVRMRIANYRSHAKVFCKCLRIAYTLLDKIRIASPGPDLAKSEAKSCHKMAVKWTSRRRSCKKSTDRKKYSWNTWRRSRARWFWKQTKSRGSIQGWSQNFELIQPGWAFFWGTWCGWNGGAGRKRPRWTGGGSPNARWV